MVKRVPLPLCGVMLATASLGTLLQPYVPAAHPICGVVACVLLALILAKCIIFPELVLADLKIQVTAAVAGTFPMGLMSLSTYLVPYSLAWSFAVWVLALAVYLPLLLNYFIRFIVHGKLDNLTPASFVILVGFVISILTGTKYQLHAFFTVVFWVGLVAAFVIVAAVTLRYMRKPLREISMRPLLCIYTAPPSMMFSCALALELPMSDDFLICCYAVCCCLYVFAFVQMIRSLRLGFYPTFASLTFPFVISATASKMTAAALGAASTAATVQAIAYFEMIVAVCIVSYVLVRFAMFILAADEKGAPTVKVLP